MANEFEKIMSFFSLSAEEKAKHLKDVFDESIEFFEKFKHVMQHGTADEKKGMLEQVKKMQEQMQEETIKIKEKTGLSDTELQDFANSPQNFSETDWNIIQSAKQTIGKQANEISNLIGTPGPKGEEPRSSKPMKKPKKWVKS